MSVANYDIELFQGADYSLTITVKDSNGDAVDLTGYSASMYIANDRDSSPDLTLTGGAGLTLGGTAGTIQVAITDTQVDAISWTKGEYDLVTTDGSGNKERKLQGSVFVNEQVPTS